MKKWPTPPDKNDGAALEFPIAPDFSSRAPQIDPQAMLARIAESMTLKKKRPGEDARRAAEKIPVEFVL